MNRKTTLAYGFVEIQHSHALHKITNHLLLTRTCHWVFSQISACCPRLFYSSLSIWHCADITDGTFRLTSRMHGDTASSVHPQPVLVQQNAIVQYPHPKRGTRPPLNRNDHSGLHHERSGYPKATYTLGKRGRGRRKEDVLCGGGNQHCLRQWPSLYHYTPGPTHRGLCLEFMWKHLSQ